MSAMKVKRANTQLDRLGPGAVVLDRYGHAWQGARRYHLGVAYPTGYWYRAYDGYDASEVSTYELSAFAPFTVLHSGETNERESNA